MSSTATAALPQITPIDGRLMIPHDEILPNPDQPREYFDPVAMGDLVANIIKFGPEKPITVMPLEHPQGKARFMIVDGEFRWRACVKAQALVWVVLTPRITDPEALFEKSLNANFPQAPHTTMEVIRAILRLENNGRTVEEIAVIFGKSMVWVNTHKRLATLHPKVLTLMKPEIPEDKRLPVMHAADLADLPHSEQVGLAEMVVTSGLSRAHLKNLVRMSQASRSTPVSHRRHMDKEMQGLINQFIRLNDFIALFVTHPAELDRIVGGRKKTEVARLLAAIEQTRQHGEKILKALAKHQ